MEDYRLSGVVQCGPSRFIREKELDDGRKPYRVVATVLPHFWNQPRPGAEWTHQEGIGSPFETWEQIEERNRYPAGIYGFRGRRSQFPYEERK